MLSRWKVLWLTLRFQKDNWVKVPIILNTVLSVGRVHRGNAALFNDEGAKKKATTYYLQEDSIVGLWEKISKTLFYQLPFTIDKIIFSRLLSFFWMDLEDYKYVLYETDWTSNPFLFSGTLQRATIWDLSSLPKAQSMWPVFKTAK